MNRWKIFALLAVASGVAVAAANIRTCQKLRTYEPVMTLISGGYEYDYVDRWVCDS